MTLSDVDLRPSQMFFYTKMFEAFLFQIVISIQINIAIYAQDFTSKINCYFAIIFQDV